ncbi:MAG TPA: isochorismatase family protein [Candidatus Binatia bacterium]|jgi:nicotinamidase-related amidase
MIPVRSLVVTGVLLFSAVLAAQEGPNRPEAKPLTLDSKTTAILVLDLNARCHDAGQVCSKLMPAMGEFLEKARAAAVPIIYSVSASAKGKPLGEVASPLKRKENEPVIYPDGFDKFNGGELQALLKEKGTKTVVVTGASTNSAVLYTATTAARMHRYNVVVPMDGMIAEKKYEQEYTFHQFTVLPSEAHKQFQFTTLSLITFK